MTIEELLAMAQRSLELSDPPRETVTPGEVAISTMYAAIAQAAALTAQAMIAAEQHKFDTMRHQLWIDNTFGEIPDELFEIEPQ